MPHADFVHLRVHSAYSLSEGAIKADKIAALAREAAHARGGDHRHRQSVRRAGILARPAPRKGVQPIIGCQIALTRADNPRLPPDPVVLLAQNAGGAGQSAAPVLGRLPGDRARR